MQDKLKIFINIKKSGTESTLGFIVTKFAMFLLFFKEKF